MHVISLPSACAGTWDTLSEGAVIGIITASIMLALGLGALIISATHSSAAGAAAAKSAAEGTTMPSVTQESPQA